MLAGRRAELGEAVAARIRDDGGEAVFVRADISRAGDVAAMMAAAVDRFGGIDIAVNNAGAGAASARFAKLSEADYDRLFNVNVRGTFLCMQAELAQMVAQGRGGAIVNVTSLAAHVAMPNAAIYTASKHAILGFTKAAAVDHGRDGIRVNALSPGAVSTAMGDGWAPGADVTPMLNRIALGGRYAQAQDMVGTAIYLASDLARFTTGTAVIADGGFLAW